MEKIHLIYGPKGCGKTKKLVQIANDSVKTAKGVLIYVDKDNSRLHDLAHAIKLVDTSEYGVSTEDNFVAFVNYLYDTVKKYLTKASSSFPICLSNLLPCRNQPMWNLFLPLAMIKRNYLPL